MDLGESYSNARSVVSTLLDCTMIVLIGTADISASGHPVLNRYQLSQPELTQRSFTG
jgi:hypothetical protein